MEKEEKTEKKKILMIATMPFFLIKGSTLRAHSIIKNLSKKYEIDLVTYSLGKDIQMENLRIFRTPEFFKPKLDIGKVSISKMILDLFVLLKARKLIKKQNYDIIHCEDFESLAIGYLLKKSNKNKRLVYDLHNRVVDNMELNEKSFLAKVLSYLEKKFIRKTDQVILNWQVYEKDEVFSNKNRFLYYDRVDDEIKPINFNERDYIIYVGNFRSYQGIIEFLYLFKNLERKLKIVLVGEPTKGLKRFLLDYNLNGRVILTGRLGIKETNYLIKKSLFAVLPRVKGRQSSTKLITYFLLGKPVLVREDRINKELLFENQNSISYNKANLKDKINNILKNPKILKKLESGAQKTRRLILSNLNNTRFITEYENGIQAY